MNALIPFLPKFWMQLGAALCLAAGLNGCVSNGGGEGEPAQMTNEYGDLIGSPADQQLEMEEEMESVTNSLIR